MEGERNYYWMDGVMVAERGGDGERLLWDVPAQHLSCKVEQRGARRENENKRIEP